MIAGITGMDGLEYGSPEHRDCVRDVIALLEQALVIQGGLTGDDQQARQNLTVLIDNCQIESCLYVALSMLATSWQMVCHIRASARGTSAEQELEHILATFRGRLT